MKNLFLLPLMVVSALAHAENSDCVSKQTLIQTNVAFQLCKNSNQISSLPQVKFYSENSDIGGKKVIVKLKGYIQTPSGKNLMLKEETDILGATLRIDLANLPVTTSHTEYSELALNPDDEMIAPFGKGLLYGQYKLKNASLDIVQLASYTTLAPIFSNTYIFPNEKINSISIEPQTCKFIKGQMDALRSCEMLPDDNNKYVCSCQYEFVK